MAKNFVGQEYVAATNGKGLHQESKGTRILGRVTIALSSCITLLSTIIIVCCIIFGLSPINGTSMMRTLNASAQDTDTAVTCLLGEPARGDIVIAKLYLHHTSDYTNSANYTTDQNGNRVLTAHAKERYPYTDQQGRYMNVIKRVIAKAGDQLSMGCENINGTDEYYLYLNGVKLNEDYLDPTLGNHTAKNFRDFWYVLENPNPYTLLDWRAVPYQDCVTENTHAAATAGIPSTRMLTIPDGHVFFMGDCRDDFYEILDNGTRQYHSESWDCTNFGPLPADDIICRCIDFVANDVNMPQYLWNKFVYYVCFGWAWQK